MYLSPSNLFSLWRSSVWFLYFLFMWSTWGVYMTRILVYLLCTPRTYPTYIPHVLNIFSHPSSGAKWTDESSELDRSLSLDIQILDTTIWSWSKYLKNPYKSIFVRFQMFYTIKLINSLFRLYSYKLIFVRF